MQFLFSKLTCVPPIRALRPGFLCALTDQRLDQDLLNETPKTRVFCSIPLIRDKPLVRRIFVHIFKHIQLKTSFSTVNSNYTTQMSLVIDHSWL